MTKMTSLAAAALIVCGCTGLACAQTAPAEPSPVADKGTTAQLNCVEENGKHLRAGNHLIYRTEMSNKCEQRIKCRVFAAAYTSKGPSIGHATLVLAPKSRGAPPQVYDFKVKGAGGMTSTSRECAVF
jgi:hypothetical protein